MKYLDDFRDPAVARRLVQEIHATARRKHTIMEVCGGQTHSLLRYGIAEELSDVVELIHGPGCPVCVTPASAIDAACQLATGDDVTIVSFGDMLRVPGSNASLLDARSSGGSVRLVYSPLDAVRIAQEQPETQVVFLAVGFETTAPATALAVLQAEQLKLTNFAVLANHVRVLPAMELLMQASDCRIEAFLAAGHVCTVTGITQYEAFVQRYRVPVVVAGFEPVDLLAGILECVRLCELQTPKLVNCYERSVETIGNRSAQDVVDEVYEVADMTWRGMAEIPAGGYRLRDRFAQFDAMKRFSVGDTAVAIDSTDCRSGDILSGRIKPPDCPAFGGRCTPESPLGAPMVSSEGACAAYYRYSRRSTAS